MFDYFGVKEIFMKLSFEHKDELIEFDVVFSRRKTLGIEVRPPGTVRVAAPTGTSKDRIMSVMIEKGHWVSEKLKHMRALAESSAPFESFTEGSAILFLGKAYRLKILEDSKYDIPRIEIQNDNLYIYTASPHEALIENAIEKWRSQMTKLHLENRIQHYQQFFSVTPSRVIVKPQKRRWGSCNSKRELRFNKACIKVSERALDYLVVHEMSHLVHMNHSKAFWTQVEEIMPDYKAARAELKKTLI